MDFKSNQVEPCKKVYYELRENDKRNKRNLAVISVAEIFRIPLSTQENGDKKSRAVRAKEFCQLMANGEQEENP